MTGIASDAEGRAFGCANGDGDGPGRVTLNAVFGDVGKALVVAVGTVVFLVVGIALAIRERRGGSP
jgi:hypothetical protein